MAPGWITRGKERVGIGDLVALSMLKHSDAVGRILGPVGEGLVLCELIRGGNKAAGKTVVVEPDQLLVRVWS